MRARGPVLFALTGLLVAACTFPDVTYSTPPDGGGDVGPGDGTTGNEGGDDASIDVSEDRVADVVSDRAFEAAPDADPCDKDGDGFLDAKNKAQCGSTADDCCDTDFDAHPKQSGWYTVQDHCNSFDYNCDGTLQGEYAINVACTGGGALGCSGTAGFMADPGCGGSGEFYSSCVPTGLTTCGFTSTQTTTQGCH
jgi:hypothetical protein